MKASPKRFRVAFSFAGQKRQFVSKVAAILTQHFSRAEILYDKYHEAEFAHSDLGIDLPDLYHKESDLVVVVICKDYESKEWCGLEWKAIHALIKERRVEEVMLCRFDHALIKGLYSTAGFSEWDHKTAQEAADLILQRFDLNERKTKKAKGSKKPTATTTYTTAPHNGPRRSFGLGCTRSRTIPKHLPRILHWDDPQKGRWGGRDECFGRKLSATVTEIQKNVFYVDLEVRSTDGSKLRGPIRFHLHDTFPKSILGIKKIQGGNLAVLEDVSAWEVFTVGAQVKDKDGYWTSLELDLAKLRSIPKRFK